MKKSSLTAGFGAIVLSVVLILVIPLPPPLLDALLAFNILCSGIVLLASITVKDPLEFSAFAPALLVATLFRLSLDVSATRLILTQGATPGGVGAIIPAFGDFVVRGNLVVGLIMFAILVTIQFIVIASGSQRVAEVAARFTLDAMPGKQMGLDAELHSGAITAEAARTRRALIQKEADFFGAMDGAGKFVKGDAIAALVIVLLNLIGGIAVGIFYHGLSPQDAINTFALLSIGNALVTTLPAFLMSIAMGMMVTRVAADDSLGADLGSQLLRRPEVLRAAGLLSFALACVPVLPHALFAVFGVVVLVIAQAAHRSKRAEIAAQAAATDARARTEARRPEAAFRSVGTDLVSVDVGRGLMALFSPENGEQIIERVVEARRMIARETGVVLAGVHIRDDATREPDTYEIRFRGEVVGSGRLMLDRYMAIADRDSTAAIDGEPALDPVYGFPITWIAREDRDYAMSVGAIVVDAITVLVSHVTECARLRATLLFGRQEMQTLLEHLKPTHPAIVKEIGTDALPFATAHKAFTILLREHVWPRNPIAALEAMIDAAATSRDPRELADAARRVLVAPMLHSRQLKELPALMFDPVFRAQLCAAWIGADGAAADPQLALHIRAEVDAYVRASGGAKHIVCTSPFRRQLSDLLERFGLRADVFSFGELPTDIAVKPTVIVTTPSAKKALAAIT